MPEMVGHWKCLVNLAAPWGWGIGGDLELHCEGIILADNCSETKQVQNHHVFHSVFCTSMASVSLQVLDMVTTQPPDFIIKLGKIAGVLQLCCHQYHLRSSLSSFTWHKKPPKVTKLHGLLKF